MGGKLPKGVETHGNFKSIEPKDTPTFVSKKSDRLMLLKITLKLRFSIYGIVLELGRDHVIQRLI